MVGVSEGVPFVEMVCTCVTELCEGDVGEVT